MAVDYEKKGKIAIMTINRPEARNALGADVSREMNEAMVDFRDDPNLWVAIITGAGDKAFSAGADIKGFARGLDSSGAGTAEPARTVERVRADQIWKPFIAAINGYALGGGLELAMTCDIRIAAEHAELGQPEINIGIIAGAGGTQRLPRFVPRAMAAKILLTGERISAQEALRIGLVSDVVPLDQLMPTAMQIAETICQKAPLSVRATKQAMIQGYSLPLDQGLQLEHELAVGLRSTKDRAEGVRAFVEKRAPVFKAE